MKRRSAVAVLGSALGDLAGCADRLRTDPTAADGAATVADSFDGGPDRPDRAVESRSVEVTVSNETREYETAATVPYPDPPTAFDADAVADWVPAFEEAYVTHRALCGREGSGEIIDIGHATDRVEVLDRAGDATVAYLRYAGGATAGVDDGALWQADIGYAATAYAVDENRRGASRARSADRPRTRGVRVALPRPGRGGDARGGVRLTEPRSIHCRWRESSDTDTTLSTDPDCPGVVGWQSGPLRRS